MPVFKDQTGRKIPLNKTPGRIISLVPSQTELLYDLGLHNEVIGITKFCVHPEEWFRTKSRVGGTKQLNIEKIWRLQPELIIANKEENVKEQIEELEKHFPVWISDVRNLQDAFEMINRIGELVTKKETAETLIEQIKTNFSQLQISNRKPQTCYLIWRNPYMSVGGDTFINSMMEAAGFENIFKEQHRYPEMRIEELRILNTELLLLSSEPFPFKQKHVEELQPQLPHTKIILVDGQMFSWYGSRLLKAPGYFKELQQKIIHH